MNTFKPTKKCYFQGHLWDPQRDRNYQWSPGLPAPSLHMIPVGPVSPDCQALIDAKLEGAKESKENRKKKAENAETSAESSAALAAEQAKNAALEARLALLEMKLDAKAPEPTVKPGPPSMAVIKRKAKELEIPRRSKLSNPALRAAVEEAEAALEMAMLGIDPEPEPEDPLN